MDLLPRTVHWWVKQRHAECLWNLEYYPRVSRRVVPYTDRAIDISSHTDGYERVGGVIADNEAA